MQKHVYANHAVFYGDCEAAQFIAAGAPLLPPGVVLPYGGATAPGGYLLCDGSAVSRTKYAALFKAIGTAYGPGDGSTTFNVPNLTDGIFPRGGTPGNSGGAASHSHGLSSNGQALITLGGTSVTASEEAVASWTGTDRVIGSSGTPGSASRATALAGNTDGSTWMPPYVAFAFIIRY